MAGLGYRAPVDYNLAALHQMLQQRLGSGATPGSNLAFPRMHLPGAGTGDPRLPGGGTTFGGGGGGMAGGDAPTMPLPLPQRGPAPGGGPIAWPSPFHNNPVTVGGGGGGGGDAPQFPLPLPQLFHGDPGGTAPQFPLTLPQVSHGTPGASQPPPAPPGVTAPVGGGGPTPAMIGAPPTPEAYSAALQASFAPYFQQSQNDLAAREASMGILNSGAANKDFQDLTARNNATFANALAPLIQQGFGQQFQANVGNAGAYNQVLGQMLGINANDQALNAQLGLQGQEFNSNLVNQALMQNTDIANQFKLAGAGFGNSDYLNALGQLAGFQGTGLSGLGYILGQGMQNQFNGYTGGYQSMLPYGQQIGQSQGYNIPSFSNGFNAGAFQGSLGQFANGPGTTAQPVPVNITNPSVDPNAPPDPSLMPPPLDTSGG